MNVTGHRLQSLVREIEACIEGQRRMFEENIQYFEDEKANHVDPLKIGERLSAMNALLTLVQTQQAAYNLSVTVEVLGKKISLAQAVKLVGLAGGEEKMWREAVSLKRDRYGEMTRKNKDEVLAVRAIPYDIAVRCVRRAAQWVNALRLAIAQGNTQERPAVYLNEADLKVLDDGGL